MADFISNSAILTTIRPSAVLAVAAGTAPRRKNGRVSPKSLPSLDLAYCFHKMSYFTEGTIWTLTESGRHDQQLSGLVAPAIKSLQFSPSAAHRDEMPLVQKGAKFMAGILSPGATGFGNGRLYGLVLRQCEESPTIGLPTKRTANRVQAATPAKQLRLFGLLLWGTLKSGVLVAG